MKSLLEHLTECMVDEARWYGAGGSIRYKLAPVMNSICKAAELNKILTQSNKMIQEITGNDKVELYGDDKWEVYEVNGKQAILKSWIAHLWKAFDDDKEQEAAVKKLEKTFGIQSTSESSNVSGSANVNDAVGKYGIKVPDPCTMLAKIEDEEYFILSIMVFVEDIQEIWDKYNPTTTFNFKKFGNPGGLNDAAGRTLQVGDIVAFMRRAGTGGMELGVVSGLGNKRPNIQTESGNSVSLDGTQICLVQRGNLVVQ